MTLPRRPNAGNVDSALREIAPQGSHVQNDVFIATEALADEILLSWDETIAKLSAEGIFRPRKK
jgi:hypothetical protein